ncbi:MAG: dehydrogenase [Acidobacteriia bacterium]|nr:dehydrogenase [Terriglobia bacterium]
MSKPDTFRVGLSPDFYTDAKGYFEEPVQEVFGSVPWIDCGPMPPQPGNIATPEALNQFDAIINLALRMGADSLRGVDRLAIVARWGVGYDRIDVAALTEADVILSITPEGVRAPVAEAILAFVFALSKNMFRMDRMTRAGQWRDQLGELNGDIRGSVLGSVGCGNIARKLFRLARPLGFRRLLACDPLVTPREVKHLGVELVEMDTVFRDSDFVTVNTFLNDTTRGLVGQGHFRLMKPTAYFINTARGPIVQHEALVKALKEKWIAGAGIDVFPTEPPPRNDPLFELDNVILAPHALAWTKNIMHDNGVEACGHVLKVALGEVPERVVNPEVLNRPGFRRKLERYR